MRRKKITPRNALEAIAADLAANIRAIDAAPASKPVDRESMRASFDIRLALAQAALNR